MQLYIMITGMHNLFMQKNPDFFNHFSYISFVVILLKTAFLCPLVIFFYLIRHKFFFCKHLSSHTRKPLSYPHAVTSHSIDIAVSISPLCITNLSIYILRLYQITSLLQARLA